MLKDALKTLGKKLIEASLAGILALSKGALQPLIDQIMKDLKDMRNNAVQNAIDNLLKDYKVVVSSGGPQTINGETVEGTVVTVIDRNTGQTQTIIDGTITSGGVPTTVHWTIDGKIVDGTVQLDLTTIK